MFVFIFNYCISFTIEFQFIIPSESFNTYNSLELKGIIIRCKCLTYFYNVMITKKSTKKKKEEQISLCNKIFSQIFSAQLKKLILKMRQNMYKTKTSTEWEDKKILDDVSKIVMFLRDCYYLGWDQSDPLHRDFSSSGKIFHFPCLSKKLIKILILPKAEILPWEIRRDWRTYVYLMI